MGHAIDGYLYPPNISYEIEDTKLTTVLLPKVQLKNVFVGIVPRAIKTCGPREPAAGSRVCCPVFDRNGFRKGMVSPRVWLRQ